MSPFERLFAVMTKPWMIICVLTLIVLSFLYIDKTLAVYFHFIDLRTHARILNWVTKLGIGMVYIPAFFILMLFFRYIRPNHEAEARSWFLFLCVLIPSLICGVLKVVLGRARPSMWFEGQYYGFYGLQMKAPFWSFPSGHTTTIMAVALGLGILYPRHFYALLATGFTVALSRVLLTHHYLSDVLFACYLTLIEIGILLYCLRRKSCLAPIWRHAV